MNMQTNLKMKLKQTLKAESNDKSEYECNDD